MTRPAQPEPYPGDPVGEHIPGSITYRRTYRDPLGRPLVGKVTITGSERTDANGVTVLPAPVVVDVHDGTLSVDLPPDTYRVSAVLRTREGSKVTDNDTVVLGE